jgi:2-enoate reductase
VYSAIDVLDQAVSLKGKTAVIGGGLVGLETALFLAENNVRPIVIIETTDKLGGNVGLRSGWVVRTNVTECCDIEVRTQTTVEQIKDHSIVLQKNGEIEELEVRNVVIAIGMRNNNFLAEELKATGAVEELYMVGDCNIPRSVKEAIEEAAIAARMV